MKETLRDKVAFDRDALDDAIEEQSGLFLEASDAVANAMSLRDEAKSLMDQESARACDRARKGEDKKTEAAVKESAQLDKKYLLAEAQYRHAKLAADLATSVRESFDMRGKMLKEMCQLYISGYYQASGVGGKVKREIDRDAATSARVQMNRARIARREEKA
jgi:hypothetical protein